MLKYTLRQLASAVVLLFIGTALTFILVYANTEGIAYQILGVNAQPSAVAAKEAELGFDRPVVQQYLDWLLKALQGDLGRSLYTDQPVTDLFSTRLAVTLTLVFISVALTLVLSVIIGVTAAVKGGWVDRTLQVIGVLGGAIPNLIVAVGLVFAFAVAWEIFPATGYVSPTVSVAKWAMSLILPITAILVGSVAGAALQFRGSMIDVMSQDFIRALRARGISERAIIYRHALRNAAIPGLTTISLQTIGLIGGVVIIERIFAIPGVAVQLNTSSLGRDIPVVMGGVLITIVMVIVVNITLGIIAGLINPKARVS